MAATTPAVPATTESYVYRDEDGERIYRVVRGPNKRFHIERYSNGQWRKGIQGVKRVLYNLPAVLDAVANNKVVWLVEGEKDADRLIAEGLTATTMPGGAGKWLDEYSHMLLGAQRVNIIWDNDPPDKRTGKYPGQEHALLVESKLRAVAIPVRFYRAFKGNDVSDHLDAGYHITDLVQERPGPPMQVERTNGHVEAPTDDRLPLAFRWALHKLHEHAAQHNLTPPRRTERGWEACCPAHDDRNPSLGIRVGDEQPLVVSCQAGCELHEIAAALELDVGDFFDEEAVRDADVQRELRRMRARDEARVILQSESMPDIEAPTLDPSRYMNDPVPDYVYTVDSLHITGSNTLIISKYKAGKTTLMINLFRSLVNIEPFLGRFEVLDTPGKIAYMDYEMLEKQFRIWLQHGGGLNYTRMVTPWHLRGKSLPFWMKPVRKQLVEWLAGNNVCALIVDTAARAWSGLVENENSNSEILRFTDMLDAVKDEAGLTDLFLVTHMGRNLFVPEGEERARGATRLEDWMDVGWYLTSDDKGIRYLRALGRGVDLESITLSYEPSTHLLLSSGVSKKEFQALHAMENVVDMIAAFDKAPSMTELKDVMTGGDNSAKHRWILEAEQRGYVVRVKGQGRSMRCRLTELGEQLHERKVRAQ